jgi:signal peptidase I
MNYLKNFWAFLKEDSWQSWVVSLVLLLVLIRFIIFPGLSFVTGSPLPLVVIESCSLYHQSSFDDWWFEKGAWYESHGIEKEDFKDFPFYNGLNKGDIILVWGRGDYETGDIIIFEPNPGAKARHPIIHRIVSESPIGTKGDHNNKQLVSGNNIEGIDETNIPEEMIIGKSVVRVPLLGWVKLIFFEPLKVPGQRGFCTGNS